MHGKRVGSVDGGVAHPGLRFWGKFSSEDEWLPLAAHCLDVGVVLRGLLGTSGIQRALCASSERALTPNDGDRLAVLAMLHDAGKANLGFQRKVLSRSNPRAGHIRE